MAVFVVDTGAVSSWTGTANTALISGGSAPTQFTLSAEAPEHKQTAMNASGVVSDSFIRGISAWTVSMTAQLGIPHLGATGLVTAGNITNTRGWTLNINAEEKLATIHSGSGVTFHSYLPGLINWGGTIDAFVDDTTAIVLPSTITSAVFKMLENASDDHTFTGDILVLNSSPTAQVGEMATQSYSFRGTGALTAAGASGTGIPAPIFAAAVVARPVVGALTLQSKASRTYSGNAFWTGVSISCVVDQPISVTITARGTGALTPG